MEDTLGAVSDQPDTELTKVLILVLMEDTLGECIQLCRSLTIFQCLNPCFNGRYSRRFISFLKSPKVMMS